ncbi:MAG: penicillin-binding protein activator LpoB [Treponema sp.]|jgi:hypothetical protein|nr:penicillin-binding protein activator LpoB [Treponema sp.]
MFYEEIIIFIVITIGGYSQYAQEREQGMLDESIRRAGSYLEGQMRTNSIAAIPTISSDNEKLSDYIIEQLTETIVNNKKLTIVDRKRLGLIKEELDFQYSVEVSDETMQAIGQKLGAQKKLYGQRFFPR